MVLKKFYEKLTNGCLPGFFFLFFLPGFLKTHTSVKNLYNEGECIDTCFYFSS